MTATNTTTRYYSASETAKIIRSILKEQFPGVKFSVRSETFAGGDAVRVGWMDGPPEKMVDKAIGWLKGSTFDGMIDLKTSRYVEYEGQRASFADYITLSRRYSAAFLAWASVVVAERCGLPPLEVTEEGEFGAYLIGGAKDVNLSKGFGHADWLTWRIMEHAGLTDARTYETYERYDARFNWDS